MPVMEVSGRHSRARRGLIWLARAGMPLPRTHRGIVKRCRVHDLSKTKRKGEELRQICARRLAQK